MAFEGLDIAALQKFADTLNTAAKKFSKIETELTDQVNTLPWKGRDFDFFKKSWTTTHSANLDAVGKSFAATARGADAQAKEQEATSN